jgi:hypothetical protein
VKNTAKGSKKISEIEIKDVTSQSGTSKNFSIKEVSRDNVYAALTEFLQARHLISSKEYVNNLTVKTPGFASYYLWVHEDKE